MLLLHSKLIQLLKTHSIRTGKLFELSSGQFSDIYCDVKKTALGAQGSAILSELLGHAVAQYEPYSAVAGVVLGGCHLASLLQQYVPSLYLDHEGKSVIFVRKEVKGHGTQSLLEMPDLPVGSSAILVEDVITTGNSALRAAEVLEAAGIPVKAILAVVDRRTLKSKYLGRYPVEALVDFEELVSRPQDQDEEIISE
jgi:orotate phosphoribosyltransferase